MGGKKANRKKENKGDIRRGRSRISGKWVHIYLSFDHCDCIVFRLYVKLLSTHGPNLAYCAIFLNKLVNL